MVGSFMAILDTTVVDVVVPKMMGPLSTDLYGVQWVITSYMTAAAVGLLLTHNLGKVMGLKWLFLSGIFIFTLASTLCGMATSLPQMMATRTLQGLGEAFIMATTQTILFMIYPPDKQGLAMGIYAMGVSFAPSLGPTVGGWITQHLSWRWVFYINLPVGVLNFIAGTAYLPPLVKKHARLRFNFTSYFFLGAFTVLLLILLSKGQQLGWWQSSTIVLLSFAAALALMAYFLNELMSRRPLIDPSIFAIREYSLSMGFYFLIMGLSIYQVFYLLPLYYETLKLLGTFSTGLHMLAFAIFIAVASPLAGVLSDRFGPHVVIVVSTILYLFTSYFLIPSLNYYTPTTRSILLTIPLGIALGTFFAPVSALALGKLGDKTALGVSLMHYLRFVGGSLGTAIATNTLEKRLAVHYEGIAVMQNLNYVEQFIHRAALGIEPFFQEDIAKAKAAVILGNVERLKALSLAFQDTFRHSFIFAAMGSVFLILLLVYTRRPAVEG